LIRKAAHKYVGEIELRLAKGLKLYFEVERSKQK